MKKKTNIRQVIRKIVREEVAMAIQEVITELKQPTQQVSQPKPKKKIVEKKSFTNNSVLNDVLNETAADGDWKTLNGGVQTTENMDNILGNSYSDLMNPNQTETPVNMATSMGVDPNDPANSFLTKDYSKLVKAMDDKAKQTRGS